MISNNTRVKYACYTSNVAMSVVCNLSPLLFLTFNEHFGIKYSEMGLLIVFNFFTQLLIDIIFSFFSHKFNISVTVKIMPFLAFTGFLLYGLVPYFLPGLALIGLIIGTVIFSVSNGLAEVLLNPIITAIPSDNPEREISKLHSTYAWGSVFMIIFGTIVLKVLGSDKWFILPLILSVIPFIAFILFIGSKIPEIPNQKKVYGAAGIFKNHTLLLCVLIIFLGGATELVMAQWGSGYLERVFSVPKVWGDIFGVALFAVMLGVGRTFYAKYGKNIFKFLIVCAIGSSICYITVAITNIKIVGIIFCALTGFFASMMWPGSILILSEKIKNPSVFMYAMMAAGGDFGAAVVPQITGLIADFTVSNEFFSSIATNLSLTKDQLGLKLGMLFGAIFPLVLIPILIYFSKKNTD